MIEQAEALRDQLRAADIPATIDPAAAATNLPTVLVTPPTLDLTDRAATWQLAALSAHPGGTLAAWVELHDLVERASEVLNVETATPASYALTPSTGTVPAYLLRLTTSY